MYIQTNKQTNKQIHFQDNHDNEVFEIEKSLSSYQTLGSLVSSRSKNNPNTITNTITNTPTPTPRSGNVEGEGEKKTSMNMIGNRIGSGRGVTSLMDMMK